MPTFDLQAKARPGLDWYLLRAGAVHLYWRSSVLNETVGWLRDRGYQIVELDAELWATESDMNEGLADAFGFRSLYSDYVGRSLDALNDCLGDVAMYEYGSSPDATGTVLVLTHFDAFARRRSRAAWVLLDIWANAARTGMLIGHRMVCLLQSNDADIGFDPVGATPVSWNIAESPRSIRTPDTP
jgi:hypothetical protein